MRHAGTRIGVGVFAAAFVFGFSGCAPSRPPAAPAGADEQYTIAVDGPTAAAASALRVMRADLKAVARRDPAAASKHLATLREQVAATDVLTAEVKKMPHVVRLKLTDAQVAEVVEQLVATWPAIIAHYADGIDFERIAVVGGDGPQTTVLAPAHGRDGEAIIRVRCARMSDGSWRVSRIDFVPRPAGTTQPATSLGPPG